MATFLHVRPFVILTAVLLLGAPACGENQAKVPTDQATVYELISVNDTSFAARKRLSARIVAPTAVTHEQRAQTALKAAVDLQKERRVDAVGVFLEISSRLAGQGFVLAIASYAPDRRGWGGEPLRHETWEAQATGHVVPQNVIKIAELWFQHRDRFQMDDGFGGTITDEPALELHIAGLLGVDRAEVSLLPLMEVITTRQEYNG